jgi:hypothetical protein
MISRRSQDEERTKKDIMLDATRRTLAFGRVTTPSEDD